MQTLSIHNPGERHAGVIVPQPLLGVPHAISIHNPGERHAGVIDPQPRRGARR
jgi:hypothetical protein